MHFCETLYLFRKPKIVLFERPDIAARIAFARTHWRPDANDGPMTWKY